jgi:hypothetical protein
LCGGDAGRVKGMGGRFSKPVMPGETITVSIWKQNGSAVFQTRNSAGAVVLAHGIDRATVALAAEQIGVMERSVRLAVEYAKVREQFGRKIGSFQAVKQGLADI